VNQYQRRVDPHPESRQHVKGYAAQEQKVLIGVTEARARANSIQVTPEVPQQPAAVQKYQAAQGDLTQALKSLMVVVERYPELKSDQNFRDLQSQLEGTENRIAVARNRYIQAVQNYNVTVRSFPVNLTAKMFRFPGENPTSRSPTSSRSRPPRRSASTPRPGTPAAPSAARCRRRPQDNPRRNDRRVKPRPPLGGTGAAAVAGPRRDRTAAGSRAVAAVCRARVAADPEADGARH